LTQHVGIKREEVVTGWNRGKSQAEVAYLEARLTDKEFLAKAPAIGIDKQRQMLYTLTDKLERLKQQILKL